MAEAEESKSENVDLLCRICANSDSQLMPVLEGEGLEHNLLKKINTYLPIKVRKDDRLPLNVCYNCASNIIGWHTLYEGCKVADVRLRKLFDEACDDDYQEGTHYEAFDCDVDIHDDSGGNESPQHDYVPQSSPSSSAQQEDSSAVAEVLAPEDGVQDGSDGAETSVIVGTEGIEVENLTEEQCSKTAEEGDLLFVKLEVPDGGAQINEPPPPEPQKKQQQRNKDNNSDNIYNCVYCTASFQDFASFEIHSNSHSVEFDESNIDSDIDKSDSSYTAFSKRRKRRCTSKYQTRSKSGRRKSNEKIIESKIEHSTSSALKKKMGLKLLNNNKSSKIIDNKKSKFKRKKSDLCIGEPEMEMRTDDKINNNYIFECAYCSRIFNRKNRLVGHIFSYHMNLPDSDCKYSCKICGCLFFWKYAYLRHVKSAHTAGSDSSATKTATTLTAYNKKKCCKICSKKFKTQYALDRHLQSKSHQYAPPTLSSDTYTCAYCERDFPQKLSLEKHMISNHIKKNNYTSVFMRGYCCEFCHVGFLQSSDLLRHRKSLHDAREITWTAYTHSVNLISLCRLCNTYFKRGVFGEHKCDGTSRTDNPDTEITDQQSSAEDEEKKFFCDVCGLRYTWRCELRLHRHNIHPDASTWNKFLKIENPVATCQICDKAFNTEQALETHDCNPDRSCDANCNLLSRFACTTCGRCFLSKENYTRHIFEIHASVNASGLDSGIEGSEHTRIKLEKRKREVIPIECMYCEAIFQTRKEIIGHLKDKHNTITESPFACKLCNRIYRRQQSLLVHNQLYHPENEDEAENEAILSGASVIINGEQAYHCHLCSRNIFIRQEFLAHYRFHNLEKEFTCETCGWQTRTKHQLNKHNKIVHLNIRDYVCDLCGKNFNRKQTRDEHRRIHTGERPFSCEVCGNTFIAMNNLISHRKFHNDYYPHECSLCPKKFKLRRSLINHVRIHTGERPYQCEICSKTYNNSSRYNYHMKVTHSDNRPFFCSICGSCFKTNKFLKRHLKLHSVRTHIQVRRRNNPTLFNKLHNLPVGDDGDTKSAPGVLAAPPRKPRTPNTNRKPKILKNNGGVNPAINSTSMVIKETEEFLILNNYHVPPAIDKGASGSLQQQSDVTPNSAGGILDYTQRSTTSSAYINQEIRQTQNHSNIRSTNNSTPQDYNNLIMKNYMEEHKTAAPQTASYSSRSMLHPHPPPPEANRNNDFSNMSDNNRMIVCRNPNEYLIRAYVVPPSSADVIGSYSGTGSEVKDLSAATNRELVYGGVPASRIQYYNEPAAGTGVQNEAAVTVVGIRDQMSSKDINYAPRIYNVQDARSVTESNDRKHLFNL